MFMKLYLMFLTFVLTSNKSCILDFAVKPHRFSQCPLSSTFLSHRIIDVKNSSDAHKSSTMLCSGHFRCFQFTRKKEENSSKDTPTLYNGRNQIRISKAHFIYLQLMCSDWGYDFAPFEKKIHLSWEDSV